MNEDMEVTVTVTPEDMEFRARAKAAGLPDVLISVYGTALRRLVAIEREACAKVCEARYMGDNNREDAEARRCAAAIRAQAADRLARHGIQLPDEDEEYGNPSF